MTDQDILNFFIDKTRNKIYEAKINIKYLTNKAPEYKEYLDNRYSEPFDKYSEVIARIYHNIEIKPQCKVCGKLLKFHSLKTPYGIWCGQKCQLKDEEFIKWRTGVIDYKTAKENRKRTCLKKYGNPNYRNLEKHKQTCLKKYGVEYAMQCDEIKEKNKLTNLKKYGVENVFQSEIIKDKCKKTKLEKYGDPNYRNLEKHKQTCLKKYGVESYLCTKNDNLKRGSSENLEKARKTNIERYGVENFTQTDKWKELNKQTCLKKYGVENYSSTNDWREKTYKTKKKNHSFNTSSIEQKLITYFKNNNINYIYQYKSILYPYMCDFYFPDTDTYVEIQGNWTHGGRPFDKNNELDVSQLKLWESKGSKYYDNAIKVWSKSDVEKRNIVGLNKIKFIEIFSIDFNHIISKLINDNIITNLI